MVKCLSCVADFGRDGWLINWIINTSGKNIYGLHSGDITHIFDGGIFYPYRHVLAYSEMFFITALWTYPIGFWIQNPGIVSGLALVSGQLLTCLIIYKWWKKMSGNGWAAMIGTLAFGLSRIRFEYQVHLQMWSMQYWLLGTYLVWSYFTDRKSWKLFLGFGVLGLQVWESLLPIYFAGVVLGVNFIFYHKLLIFNKFEFLRKLIAATLLGGMIAMPPLLTYLGVGREFNFQRSIREAANNSLAINDIWKEFASPGLYILLLIAAVQITNHKFQITEENGRNMKWLGLVMLASLILAFGPVVKWGTKTVKIGGKIPVPLPYAAAYYVIPGFGALRTPSRWIWVSGWAASGLIAIAISKIQIANHKSHILGILGCVTVAVAGGTGITRVRALPTPGQAPEVYKWLGSQPGKVMVILPMAEQEWEMERLPDIFVHNKMTLNGYSGFYPPDQADLGKELTESFPDNKTMKEMKDLKVNWVVVDKKMYNEECKIYNENCGRLELIEKTAGDKKWEDKDWAVYEI